MILKLKSAIERGLLRIPVVGRMLQRLKWAILAAPGVDRGRRWAGLRWWRLRVHWRSRGEADYDLHRRHWVAPGLIQYSYVEGSHDWRDHGMVVGGNWDLSIERFDERRVPMAIREHFVEGRPWCQTTLYCQHAALLEGRWDPTWGKKPSKLYRRVTSVAKLDERLAMVDELYKSICERGYISEKELQPTDSIDGEVHEITVRIGRHGDLLFQDGEHRLAIAKILNVPQVCVRITARHPQWVQFRRELRDYADKIGGKLYQPLLHPDLSDLPSFHGHERFEMIEPWIGEPAKRILDIGANTGYFSCRLDALGHRCVACEAKEPLIYLLHRLRRAGGHGFEIFGGSIFDYPTDEPFDAVIALNIFHHFFKQPETTKQLAAFLGRLSTERMIIEPHRTDNHGMRGAYLNMEPEAYVQWIAERTGLTRIEEIGTAADGRRLFVLEREQRTQ